MSGQVHAVVYAAKSTEDKHGSIPTQVADCEAMAQREGWTIAATYSDEGKSAYHGSRGDGLVEARDHAERVAAEHGTCMLICQHTDRLARGDGVNAMHLVEHLLWAMKTGVRIRSVQDDRTGESILDAALTGQRNFEDSARKGAATKAGMRRTIERGEWRGGIVPAGYAVQRGHDDSGRPWRKLVKHPQDHVILELIWHLAAQGASVQTIALECNRQGYMTRPVRKDHEARPFDVNRICQILDNGLYAGLVEWDGERLGMLGKWPTYTDPETFDRCKGERAQRCNLTKRKAGRPTFDRYMLSELAQCAVCGDSMQASSNRATRRYICRSRKEHAKGSPHHCDGPTFAADVVDRIVLAGLHDMLADAANLHDRLLAGHNAERERLVKTADDAKRDHDKATKAVMQMEARYAKGAESGQAEAELETILGATQVSRTNAKRAQKRLEAALDAITALGGQPAAEGADAVLERLWRSLSGQLDAVSGDIAAMNALLREWFAAFEISADGKGVTIKPWLSDDGLAKMQGKAWGPITIDAVPVDPIADKPFLGDIPEGALWLRVTDDEEGPENQASQADDNPQSGR